jgi:hypothetical protein
MAFDMGCVLPAANFMCNTGILPTCVRHEGCMSYLEIRNCHLNSSVHVISLACSVRSLRPVVRRQSFLKVITDCRFLVRPEDVVASGLDSIGESGDCQFSRYTLHW